MRANFRVRVYEPILEPLCCITSMLLLTVGMTAGPASANPCDCYFTSDCSKGKSCNLNDSDRREQETQGNICFNIAKNKNDRDDDPSNGNDDCPRSSVGGSNTCDGVCTAASSGSAVGCEDRTLVEQGIDLWAEAFLLPTQQGGGAVDATLAAQALALPFKNINTTRRIARGVLGLMQLSLGDEAIVHLATNPHFEEDHLLPDLTADACRSASASLMIKALKAELALPYSGNGIIHKIPSHCPKGLPFARSACSGSQAIICAKTVVRDVATPFRICKR